MKLTRIFGVGVALLLVLPGSAGADKKAGRVLGAVNGREITEEQVRQKSQGVLLRLEDQIYQVQKQALNLLIGDYLVEEQARKEGITVEDLLRREVDSRVGAVADAEIEKFYEERRAQINKPLAEVRQQIADVLTRNRSQMLRADYVKKLREPAHVKTFLEPPVVGVPIDETKAFVRGNPRAPVTIIEFTDYACSFCARVESDLGRLQEVYKDQIKIVVKDFPRTEATEIPAQAARCAGDQGKQAEYHAALLADQKDLGADRLKKLAAHLELDVERFSACLDEGRHAEDVRKDRAEGQRVGVTATPTFFINGRLLQGAQPITAFREIIDELLEAK